MRWYVYAALAIAALALVGWALGAVYEAGYASATNFYEAKIARAEAKASAEATRKERLLADANSRADARYAQGKRDAEAAGDHVVADLRTNALKLRREWAGCETSRLSQAAASQRELDAAEQRRRESAGRIVRATVKCDAQVAGLQEVIRAEREIE